MGKKLCNNPITALCFRIFGLLVGLTAISLQITTNVIVGGGFMVNHVLAYFTVQTNIFSTSIFAYLIVKTIYIYSKTHKLEIATISPSLHLAFTSFITITMVVFWCVLAPIIGIPLDPLLISNNLFLHTFTPLCAIIECLLFLPHGKISYKDVFKWLIYPILYLILILIIANTSTKPYYTMTIKGEKIPLMYPYPFLEPKIVGVGGTIGITFALFIFFLLFSLLYIYVDKKIAQKLKTKTLNNTQE